MAAVVTELTAGTKIEIKRFGPGILHMWEFNEEDAAEIYRVLKDYYE